jgi:menaquinone-dependent protoporphyrinogen oxidase
MAKALIAYGTRYGATAATARTIAEELKKAGLDSDVVDLKREKVKSLADYGLVVVGSGIQIMRWTAASEKFLKKNRKELANKKLALFVCCGSALPLDDKEDKNTVIEKARKNYLADKASQYGLKPAALGLFGGVYDYNRMPGILKGAMEQMKPQLEAAGVTQTQPGVYDARDMNAIRAWAGELGRSLPG